MSRFTIAQLEAFHWTATLGSVERAANKLNLSQPTISLRLKALEDALGMPLFDRSRRIIRLTAGGHELMPEVQRVLLGIERIAQRAGPPEIGGPIRIGFAEGFAVVCLSPILERLHRLYPRLQPELVVATSAAVEGDLHKHSLDVAFLVNPTAAADFTLVPLGYQAASWIASPRWGLPETVTPADLASCPIIANPPGSINYSQTVGWFGAAGLVPARLDICNSVAVLAHVVSTGAAIGIYPSKMAEADIAAGRVRLLRTEPAVHDMPICAKYAQGTRSPAVDAVLTTVREVLGGMDYLRPAAGMAAPEP